MSFMNLWRKLFGTPAYLINTTSDAAIKRRMRRLEGGMVLISNDGDPMSKWSVGYADGSTLRKDIMWRQELKCQYDANKLLSAILKTKGCLPVLMGIDKDLDAIISSILKEEKEEA